MLFKKKNKIDKSSINAISISADIVSTNTEYGHFNCGDYIGKTYTLQLDNHILEFKGGILVDVKEIKGE